MQEGLLTISPAHLPSFLKPQTWMLLSSWHPAHPLASECSSVRTRGRCCSAGVQPSPLRPPPPPPLPGVPAPSLHSQLTFQNSLLLSILKGLLCRRCGLNSPSPVLFLLNRIHLCVHACMRVRVHVFCQGRIKKKKCTHHYKGARHSVLRFKSSDHGRKISA